MVEHTRTLDFKIAFAIGLGTMIAAGIFSLSGVAVAEVGSSAVISFVIAALVAGTTAASYSEFASIYSENGGGYLFSTRTFDTDDNRGLDLLVYFIGVALFLGYTGTTAFYLSTMDEWFFRFIIPEAIPLPHGSIGILAALLLGILNAKGTEESGMFQLLVTSAKVAVLLIFIGGIVGAVGPAQATAKFTGNFEVEPINILTIASLAFITFFGFSAIAASAGEIIRPRETVPKAIAASIITVTVLYTLVIIAMVNSPVPAEVIAQEGETAMGRVASAALGPVGFWLIVAGAVFSMVSASNASVLAASGIGSLMGNQGHAPRRFSRIHPDYGTPFWSIITVTATIVVFILVFIMVLPVHGGLLDVNIAVFLPALGEIVFKGLGLTTLTGFATLNLLIPLSLVNVALIYSRRRHDDLDRPLRVPLVPLIPVIGIVANLALIYNLPPAGVVTGTVLIIGLLGAYLVWGGAPKIEELYEEVVPAPEPTTNGQGQQEIASSEGPYRVLVPVARPDRALRHVQLAATIAQARSENPLIQVLNITQIPEQTASEIVVEQAEENVAVIEDALSANNIDVDYVVEGHTCRDIAFDVLHTAREDDADLILMGYPEDHPDVTESVEYDAPCDVLFVSGPPEAGTIDAVNVGVGGGPHHLAALPLVNALADRGAEIHLIDVHTGEGVHEDPGKTLQRLADTATATVHNVRSSSIAEGLVSTAAENGGILIIGASRNRRLRQWIFGSTPDRVVNLADDAGVPVIVYASSVGISGWVEDRVFPIYRYLRKRFGRGEPATPAPAES
ncbi:MAG: amino acid permease [Halobacteriales archaeon]|nr:amino acid permease [Halobacteriales archaeon]